MAMTPEEMVVYFHGQAERSKHVWAMAQASSDYHHAAFVISHGFEERLMEGLIRWRIGMDTPVRPISEAVYWIRDGVEILRRPHGITMGSEIPVVGASLLCFLVNELPIAFDPSVLKMDCLLDAALSQALRDQWNESMWAEGFSQLKAEGRCALSIETYSTYYRLLRSQGGEVEEMVERATVLFDKRKDDEFYIGGPQTEGGDLDNTVTVDYRLAAILKKLQYDGDNMHRWRWE